jgi:multidrug efflux pump
MTLSGLAVRRPVLAMVASSLIVVFGVMAAQLLPLRELPDVDQPVVSVTTSYPGANASVVESRITQLIEDRLSGIEGVKEISSQSADGRSNITITFQLNRDLEAAANDVRDAVSRTVDALPEDADAPEVSKQDADAQPIMWFALTSDRRSVAELSDYARRYVVDRLSVVDGVARVRLGGEQDYAMRVWLDRRAMAARGITTAEVENALRSQNVELPAGQLETGAVDLTVRISREYERVEEFRRLPIASGGDHVVRLGEIAQVEIGPEERRTWFRGNGQTRIGLGIVRQSKSNALAVATNVHKQVKLINRSLPEDLRIVLTYDSTKFVEEAVNEVFITLAIAMALVVLVLYLFLGSLRAALVPAVVVPVSLIGVFIALALFGFSINIITLLALVLAIGLVVDDSIVVLENIQRRIDLGEPVALASDRGAQQVFFAVIATTAVIVAVFAPLAFLSGYIGRIFSELALTVSAAVIISSFVALTLSPMMCSKFLKPASQSRGIARWVDRAISAIRDSYQRFLSAVLSQSWIALFIIALALGWAYLLFTNLESELVPAEDRGSFFVSYTTSVGASFDHTREEAERVEKMLLEIVERGDAETVLVRVPGFGGRGFNSGIAIVVLKPWDEREKNGLAIVGEVNQRLQQITGIRGFAGMRSSLSGGNGDDIQFVIAGGDYDDINLVAEELVALAGANPNLIRPRTNFEPTSPRTIVSIDRERAAALGVSVRDIGRALEVQLGGRRVTTFIDRGEEYNVILQTALEDRRSGADLENIFVRGGSGELIPLSGVVSLRETGEAASLPRVNRLRAVSVTATLAEDASLGDAIAWFEQNAREVMGPGMSYEFLGSARDLQESNSALLFTFGLALLIVFLVLAAQFESFINPFIIMLGVPLAVAGGLFGLMAGGSTLNIYSQIGLVILIGLAAKNGILIVEFANQLRDEGRPFREAVIEAATIRFRPILMTGLSTALGALPLVLASGAGAESRQSIGLVIFYGVLISTLFTLIVTPLLYGAIGRFAGSPGTMAARLAELSAKHRDQTTQPAE